LELLEGDGSFFVNPLMGQSAVDLNELSEYLTANLFPGLGVSHAGKLLKDGVIVRERAKLPIG
jgi:hypothetical protein